MEPFKPDVCVYVCVCVCVCVIFVCYNYLINFCVISMEISTFKYYIYTAVSSKVLSWNIYPFHKAFKFIYMDVYSIVSSDLYLLIFNHYFLLLFIKYFCALFLSFMKLSNGLSNLYICLKQDLWFTNLIHFWFVILIFTLFSFLCFLFIYPLILIWGGNLTHVFNSLIFHQCVCIWLIIYMMHVYEFFSYTYEFSHIYVSFLLSLL